MTITYTKMTIDEILQNLKRELNEERYEHSIGVAEMAQKLAEKFGCDTDKAYLAGLLHDCAKCMDFELSKEIAIKNIYDLDETEKNNKKTIHAPVSAYIAREKYGISDNEILSAIRLHTIGKCNMSDFEKIIFIADKIEHRTRKIEFREKIEKYLDEKEQPLDKAMFQSFEMTIESLIKRQLPICLVTVCVYNEMLSKLK
ncbi:bis(5'-nucleosyl)-tetraphosphatase (symmetrical) YqeK [bacterium]|nr:bis(5'-nucleosyl)-tetraphosphatase (symmetrical) YqeK [bacterium]